MDIAPERRARLAAIGKVGGLTTSARNDMGQLSRSGRRAFRDSFEYGHACKVCPRTTIPLDLSDEERERRAEALYKSHYARMAVA